MLDGNGDLVGAVADMSCFEEITDASIQKFYDRLYSASITIADGNFTSTALHALCNNAVSVAQIDLVNQIAVSFSENNNGQKTVESRLNACLDLSMTPENRMNEIDSIMEDFSDESLLESVIPRRGIPVWFEPTSVQKVCNREVLLLLVL